LLNKVLAAVPVPSAALARVVAMVVTSWGLIGLRAYFAPRPASSTGLSPTAARTLLSNERS
jgi:hypothetical protein